MTTIQTQFEFTLPRGFVDSEGNIHRQGIMRLATAMDEISPLRDVRVTANQAYLTVVLLSRVVVKLGTLPQVSTDIIENLFAADLAYLQAFYRQINEEGITVIRRKCPACEQEIEIDLADLGGE
jgi:hypothetical protein